MDARHRIAALAATGLALVAPAAARAAYAPQFSFSITPATGATAAAIDSTITQAADETPSRTVTVSLPPGFTPNVGQKLGICGLDQEAALACPAGSQMGQADASVVAFGSTYALSGPVYFGGPVTARSFRLIVLLHSAVAGDQKLAGIATQRADTGVDTVFDNLPNVHVTSFHLHLDGGDSALLLTPATCGPYNVTASFVSQLDEQASGSAPITIAGGCTTGSATPSPSAAPLSPSAPSSATTPAPLRFGAPRLGRTGSLTFTLTAPARVTATVTRSGKRVARKSLAGRTGTNRVRLARRLRAGRYVVTLAAVDRSGRRVTRRAVLRVR